MAEIDSRLDAMGPTPLPEERRRACGVGQVALRVCSRDQEVPLRVLDDRREHRHRFADLPVHDHGRVDEWRRLAASTSVPRVEAGAEPMDGNVSAAQVMVDPAWIAAHLDDPDVRLIEVDVSPELYDAGHIPGALLWNAYRDLRHGGDYTPLARHEVEQLLSRCGLTPETTIVFYGYGNYLGLWLLQAYGHRDVRVMDGGRERFEATGVGWTRAVAAPAPSSYVLPDATAQLHPDRDEVRAMLDQPHAVLLDVRSREEFDGERFWPSGATAGAGRAGRLPGALHLPADALRNEQDEWKRPDELRQLFEDAGVRPGLSTVA